MDFVTDTQPHYDAKWIESALHCLEADIKELEKHSDDPQFLKLAQQLYQHRQQMVMIVGKMTTYLPIDDPPRKTAFQPVEHGPHNAIIPISPCSESPMDEWTDEELANQLIFHLNW